MSSRTRSAVQSRCTAGMPIPYLPRRPDDKWNLSAVIPSAARNLRPRPGENGVIADERGSRTAMDAEEQQNKTQMLGEDLSLGSACICGFASASICVNAVPQRKESE